MSSRRTFSTEFKVDSASLVLDQGYTVMEACKAVDVSESAMRDWVNRLKQERGGLTSIVGKALTPEQRRIQELEAKIKRIEKEKEILKKATTLLISDSIKSPL
jgi:transposase